MPVNQIVLVKRACTRGKVKKYFPRGMTLGYIALITGKDWLATWID
jgi:hypothetical protein